MKPWAVQLDDGYGFETVSEHDDAQEAIAIVKAHRADGLKPRLAKWCPSCSLYLGNFQGDRCRRCEDKRAGEVIT